MNAVLLLTDNFASLSNAWSNFTELFADAFDIITSNWALGVMVAVPIGLLILSAVLALVRSK